MKNYQITPVGKHFELWSDENGMFSKLNLSGRLNHFSDVQQVLRYFKRKIDPKGQVKQIIVKL